MATGGDLTACFPWVLHVALNITPTNLVRVCGQMKIIFVELRTGSVIFMLYSWNKCTSESISDFEITFLIKRPCKGQLNKPYAGMTQSVDVLFLLRGVLKDFKAQYARVLILHLLSA